MAVLAPGTAPAARGVLGHELQFAAVVHWRGFPLSDPSTTWCQLASTLALADLVALGDFFLTGPNPVHGHPPLATIGQLRTAVRAHCRRRGIRTAKEALDLVRCGARSRPESLLRVLMVTSGLPEPELNPSVRMADGRHKQPDIAYPEIRFGIEYEGDEHRTDRARFRSDIERKEAFSDVDWDIMRVTGDHLLRPADLAARIHRRIHKRCAELGITVDAIESRQSLEMPPR
ncbi:MAG TPA: hypothetical protein VN133_15470 [Humibacter sp.]|nr:hypothetical protein [Humibacter sp.]